MPVAFIQEFRLESDDRSTTNYDLVNERLNLGEHPPEGALFHTAGFDEDAGVFRIFDVWESQASCDRFMKERLMPILEELMAGAPDAPPPSREFAYELHDFLTG